MNDANNAGTLLPCPFCGGEASHYTSAESVFKAEWTGHVYHCTECQARVQNTDRRTAQEMWNTRALSIPNAPVEQREAIARAIRGTLVENWSCAELGTKWNEDVLLTGCKKVGNGKGYQNPEQAAQNLALDAADAVLAVRLDEAAIRKDGWQPMDTVPKDRPFLLAVEDDGEIEYHSAKYVGADKSILIAGGAFGFDRAGKRLGWCEIKPIRNGGKQP